MPRATLSAGNALVPDCRPAGDPTQPQPEAKLCDSYTACFRVQLASAPSLPLPYTGRRCESCGDGFFGDPLGLSGAPQPCHRCRCSENVDLNAVGNCDPHSGRCLRCLYNTTGTHCERCRDGFYGSALATRPADKCAREYPKSQTHGVRCGNLCPQPSFGTQTGELRKLPNQLAPLLG